MFGYRYSGYIDRAVWITLLLSIVSDITCNQRDNDDQPCLVSISNLPPICSTYAGLLRRQGLIKTIVIQRKVRGYWKKQSVYMTHSGDICSRINKNSRIRPRCRVITHKTLKQQLKLRGAHMALLIVRYLCR